MAENRLVNNINKKKDTGQPTNTNRQAVEQLRSRGLSDEDIMNFMSSNVIAPQTQREAFGSATEALKTDVLSGVADVVFGKEDDPSDDISFGDFAKEFPSALGTVATGITQAPGRAVESITMEGLQAVTGEEVGDVLPRGGDSGTNRLITKLFFGEEKTSTPSEIGVGTEKALESTAVPLTQTERRSIPGIAIGALGIALSDLYGGSTRVLNFNKIAKSKDQNKISVDITRNMPGVDKKTADEWASKLKDIDNAEDARTFVEVQSAQKGAEKAADAVTARGTMTNKTQAQDRVTELANMGAEITQGGTARLFIRGDKKSVAQARRTGDLSGVETSVTKIDAPKGQVTSRVEIPVENVHPRIGNKVIVTPMKTPINPSRRTQTVRNIEESVGKIKDPESKQDILNLRSRIDELKTMGSKATKQKAQAIKSVQEALVNSIKGLPIRERGKLVTAIKNTQDTKGLEKSLERVAKVKREFDEIQAGAKRRNQKKSQISYIKKVNDLDQALVTDAKKTIGVQKSVNDMDLNELQLLESEILARVKFKKEHGLLTKSNEVKPMSEADAQAFADYEGDGFSTLDSLKDFWKNTKEIDTFMASPNMALGKIDRSLSGALKRMESEIFVEKGKWMKIAKDISKKIGKKVTKKDRKILKGAMLNRDEKLVEEIMTKYGFQDELKQMREMLDNLREALNEAGYEVGKLDGYYPNKLKDREKFMNWLKEKKGVSKGMLQDALDERKDKLGRPVTEMEAAHLFNSLLRGFSPENVTLSLKQIDKERKIHTITPEMAQFYRDPLESLSSYLQEAVEKKHMAMLMGKIGSRVGIKDIDTVDISNSIGGVTSKLVEDGKISLEDSHTMKRALVARLNYAPTSGFVKGYKNSVYLSILNDFENMLTQVGDIILPYLQFGVRATVSGTSKKAGRGVLNLVSKTGVLNKQAVRAKQRATLMDELGVDEQADEFNDVGLLTGSVNWVMRKSGLQSVDFAIKEVGVQAAVDGYRRAIKKGPGNRKYDEFYYRASEIFDESEIKQLEQDVLNGEKSQLVLLFQINELMGIQPLSKSDMPIRYLEHPNGRVIYTLKTWTIRTLNRMRERAYMNMEQGKPVEAVRDLTMSVTALTVAGATIDEVKDWLRGEDDTIFEGYQSTAVDNLVQLFMLSRYDTRLFEDGITQEGPVSIAAEKALPGGSVITSIIHDIKQLFADDIKEGDDNWKSKQYVPLIGPFLKHEDYGANLIGGGQDSERAPGGLRSTTRERTSGGRTRSTSGLRSTTRERPEQ